MIDLRLIIRHFQTMAGSEEDMLDQYRLVEREDGGGDTENTPLDSGEASVRTKRKAEELEWLECPVGII